MLGLIVDSADVLRVRTNVLAHFESDAKRAHIVL